MEKPASDEGRAWVLTRNAVDSAQVLYWVNMMTDLMRVATNSGPVTIYLADPALHFTNGLRVQVDKDTALVNGKPYGPGDYLWDGDALVPTKAFSFAGQVAND